MYGIDKLKDVGTDLAKFGMKIEEALEDKKVSWSEALGIGVFAVPKVVKYIGDSEQIKQEFKDMDAAETEELVAHISNELDLAADSVEAIVEAGLEVIASLNKLRITVQDAKAA